MTKRYQANWASLKTHPTAEWMRAAKFGIYTHWGIYCVPATGPKRHLVPLQYVPRRQPPVRLSLQDLRASF